MADDNGNSKTVSGVVLAAAITGSALSGAAVAADDNRVEIEDGGGPNVEQVEQGAFADEIDLENPVITRPESLGPSQEEIRFELQNFMNQKGCSGCHNIDSMKIGPAYTKVAQNIQDDSSVIDRAVSKLLGENSEQNYEVGTEKGVPMAMPKQNVTEEEARQAVDLIGQLKAPEM